MEEIFSIFCHQIEGRSPNLGGEIFPICYRCAGLYLGIFFSFLFFTLIEYQSLAKKNLFFLSLFSSPWMIDGIGNFFKIWNSPGEIRMISGIFMGIFLIVVIHYALNIHSITPQTKNRFLLQIFFSFSAALFFLIMLEKNAFFFMINKFIALGGLASIIYSLINFWIDEPILRNEINHE